METLYHYEYGINWIWFYPVNGDESFRIHKGSENMKHYLDRSLKRDPWTKELIGELSCHQQ